MENLKRERDRRGRRRYLLLKRILLAGIIFLTMAAIMAAIVVHVSSKRAQVESLFRQSLSKANTDPERRKLYESYYDSLGPEKMLSIIDEPRQGYVCHKEGHELGRVIFEKTKDFHVAEAMCKDDCTDACFHGIFMEMLSPLSHNQDDNEHHLEAEDVVRLATTTCLGTLGNGFGKGSCFHAVGHGIALFSGNDLGRSIKMCEQFSDNAERYHCEGGAFMQGMMNRLDQTMFQDFPCFTFTEFPAACFRSNIDLIFNDAHGDYKKLAQTCLKLGKGLTRGCFYGLGYLQSEKVRLDPASMKEACAFGDALDQQVCVESIAEHISTIDEKSRATTMQACSFLSGSLKADCETIVRGGEGVARWNRDWSLYRNEVH